eukprot:scaffold1074_cov409-Prasinococcus_capsulatus_cf.AAC.17
MMRWAGAPFPLPRCALGRAPRAGSGGRRGVTARGTARAGGSVCGPTAIRRPVRAGVGPRGERWGGEGGPGGWKGTGGKKGRGAARVGI